VIEKIEYRLFILVYWAIFIEDSEKSLSIEMLLLTLLVDEFNKESSRESL
jgi:hypothetical protein